ncbi:hypothetical protein TSAR_009125 [Trichomalopsis sarcophagae]|uniref:Uncharacterized protein n=1 Tax=Trichomalopsis sarcophagae TaxID=543379 RepID=A0A232EKN7_9HYME|nr:hypothetical protein TSAR_009125 [Trichomalopsis sarcophagae]
MPMVVNIDDLQPLNFDIDEYIDQLLNYQNTIEDQGNHKINQTRQSAKQLIREEIKIRNIRRGSLFNKENVTRTKKENYETKILT